MKRLALLCFMVIMCAACSTSTAEQHKPIASNENTPSSFQAIPIAQQDMENWKVTFAPTSISNQVKIKVEAIYVGKHQIFNPSMTVGGTTVASSSMEPNTGFSFSNVNFSKEIKELEAKVSWRDNNGIHNGKATFAVSTAE